MRNATLKRIKNAIPSFFEKIAMFHETKFHTWRGQLIVKIKGKKSKEYLAYLVDEISKSLFFLGAKRSLPAARKEISVDVRARIAMC